MIYLNGGIESVFSNSMFYISFKKDLLLNFNSNLKNKKIGEGLLTSSSASKVFTCFSVYIYFSHIFAVFHDGNNVNQPVVLFN